MAAGYLLRALLAGAGLMLATSAAYAQAWYMFGGSYDCTGRTIGKSAVKLNCLQEVTRGNRIYTLTPSFTIRGPVAGKYVGKHKNCRLVDASETKSKQYFVDCPGISKWW